MSKSNYNETATALSDGLNQQITVMEALRGCLEDEHRALQSRDPEQLLSVTELKTNYLDAAGRINRRCSELEAQTTPAAANDPEIGRRRDQLDTLTRLCRDLNNVNGSLIRKQKHRVEKTLQIMRGEPDRPGVYGPSGTSPDRSATRRVLASI